jgi:DNA polymerase-3 subunit delta'
MPDHLDEIVGHEAAKRYVRTSLKKGILYNLLLAGPKGVGKRMFAFALAKSLGSPVNSPNFHLIGPVPPFKEKSDEKKWEKIVEYQKNYHPENTVVEVENRMSILIIQVQKLIAQLSLMPQPGSKRYVLVLEADKMTEEAANCFLKTLEEPPMDTLFVLTSSRIDNLLPTIRSRCQTLRLGYLSGQNIKSVIFEEKDEFTLNSPGEIMILQENKSIEKALEIYQKTPLPCADASNLTREFEKKKLVEILYPLLLIYRLVLYQKLNLPTESGVATRIGKKSERIALDKILGAIGLLNAAINSLEHNPNHQLLLFNILLKLP